MDLAHRVHELAQQNERIKIDSARQLNHFKSKYTEYKHKLRKANQNIATLMARIAKQRQTGCGAFRALRTNEFAPLHIIRRVGNNLVKRALWTTS